MLILSIIELNELELEGFVVVLEERVATGRVCDEAAFVEGKNDVGGDGIGFPGIALGIGEELEDVRLVGELEQEGAVLNEDEIINGKLGTVPIRRLFLKRENG